MIGTSTLTPTHIENFDGRRLRARRVDEDACLIRAVTVAVRDSDYGVAADCGGSVANSYGYPAETELVLCAAFVRGNKIHAVRRVGRKSASGARNSSAGRLDEVIQPFVDDRFKVTEEREDALRAYLSSHHPVGVISPTGRTFKVLGRLGWASGRFGWGRGSNPRRPIPEKNARRALLRAAYRRGWTVGKDQGKLTLVEPSTGEVWHIDDLMPQTIAQAPARAAQAFAQRAAQKRQTARNAELDRVLSERGTSIWVTVDDSTGAGNCPHGTDHFRKQLASRLGATGEIGAVTAATILAVRDDSYTRRACRAAAMRV